MGRRGHKAILFLQLFKTSKPPWAIEQLIFGSKPPRFYITFGVCFSTKMHVQQIKDHIIISKLWPIFYLIGCLLYQTIQTPEPNTYGGLAFCFSSHCTRPDSPLWQAKCNSLCGLGPNRNIWVTYSTWPNPNVAWNIITLFLVPLTTMNQVRSWNPLPKKQIMSICKVTRDFQPSALQKGLQYMESMNSLMLFFRNLPTVFIFC